MKEFHIDLDKHKKSTSKKILGIVSVIISIGWFIINRHHLSFFNNLYSLYFLLLGIGYYLDGTGKSIFHFLGKPHIDIMDGYLSIKSTPFAREHTFQLSNIKTLKIGLINVEINGKNKDTLTIDLTKFDYPIVIEFKEALSALSKELKLDMK